ncbi:MAG: hypothetical protein HYZ27_07955, partial [Deltaproteobacteria bacterium]|nr:hypothetical protein [Deltaproteobacteria bacterium]
AIWIVCGALAAACGREGKNDPAECGNGVAEGDEECDGNDLVGTICSDLRFLGGTLSCAGCKYDKTACVGGCGNSYVEDPLEQCDSNNLNGRTCEDEGFDAGVLRCTSDCQNFDTDGCFRAVCGDGQIHGDEVCDGVNIGNATCQSLGFTSGALSCATGCGAHNTTGCSGESCIDGNDNDGDGLVDCADGACTQRCGDACFNPPALTVPVAVAGNLTGHANTSIASCQDSAAPGIAFSVTAPYEGVLELKLNSNQNLALFVRSSCAGPELGCAEIAGAGQVERLDVDLTAGQQVLVFVGGASSGNAGSFQLRLGYRPVACGDNQAEASEVCDGNDVRNDDCTTQPGGFVTGDLSCNSTCDAFDTSACLGPGCGNGLAEIAETCDGADLKNQSCITQGFASGSLACSATCDAFDTVDCVLPVCDNGLLEPNETCESNDLNGEDCFTQGYVGGTLACNATCD